MTMFKNNKKFIAPYIRSVRQILPEMHRFLYGLFIARWRIIDILSETDSKYVQK